MQGHKNLAGSCAEIAWIVRHMNMLIDYNAYVIFTFDGEGPVRRVTHVKRPAFKAAKRFVPLKRFSKRVKVADHSWMVITVDLGVSMLEDVCVGPYSGTGNSSVGRGCSSRSLRFLRSCSIIHGGRSLTVVAAAFG